MPNTPARPRTIYFIALFAMLVALFGNATIYLVNKRTTDNITKTRSSVRLYLCSELEGLKTAQRIAANKNYDELDKNGKLLGIKITPQLRDAVRKERDEKLVQYAARDCNSFANGDVSTPPLIPIDTGKAP